MAETITERTDTSTWLAEACAGGLLLGVCTFVLAALVGKLDWQSSGLVAVGAMFGVLGVVQLARLWSHRPSVPVAATDPVQVAELVYQTALNYLPDDLRNDLHADHSFYVKPHNQRQAIDATAFAIAAQVETELQARERKRYRDIASLYDFLMAIEAGADTTRDWWCKEPRFLPTANCWMSQPRWNWLVKCLKHSEHLRAERGRGCELLADVGQILTDYQIDLQHSKPGRYVRLLPIDHEGKHYLALPDH